MLNFKAAKPRENDVYPITKDRQSMVITNVRVRDDYRLLNNGQPRFKEDDDQIGHPALEISLTKLGYQYQGGVKDKSFIASFDQEICGSLEATDESMEKYPDAKVDDRGYLYMDVDGKQKRLVDIDKTNNILKGLIDNTIGLLIGEVDISISDPGSEDFTKDVETTFRSLIGRKVDITGHKNYGKENPAWKLDKFYGFNEPIEDENAKMDEEAAQQASEEANALPVDGNENLPF